MKRIDDDSLVVLVYIYLLTGMSSRELNRIDQWYL